LNAFGGFVLEERDAVRATFDVKGVLAQLVDVVRLRALQRAVAGTGTLERLEALEEAGHLRPETVRDTGDAFRFLLDLRLQHQARQVLERLDPDNRIEPDALDAATRKRLKSVFAHIKALQANLDHEFKGA
jgi:CBS domain-containing protein